VDFQSFTQNFTLMHCSMLTLNTIPTENKNTIQFKQRLLPNCMLHYLETVTVNGGESTSQYHTPLAVAKFTGKWKKMKSGYFIATPHMVRSMKDTFVKLSLAFNLSSSSDGQI